MPAASQNQHYLCDSNESIFYSEILPLELQATTSEHPEMPNRTKHVTLCKNMGVSIDLFY